MAKLTRVNDEKQCKINQLILKIKVSKIISAFRFFFRRGIYILNNIMPMLIFLEALSND